MKTIYNEGRIVGLSNYELYVRQLLISNPEATPMSEREWLSMTLSESSSLILRVPAGTLPGYHDFMLPEGSALTAATVLYGSVFLGEVTLSEDGYWATSVTDYGQLIKNDSEGAPSTPGMPEDVPTKTDPRHLTDKQKLRCDDYMKILNGIALQPGTWTDNVYYSPLADGLADGSINPYSNEEDAPEDLGRGGKKYLEPDFSKRGFVRLLVAQETKTDVLILLHGFTYGTVLQGESGFLYQGTSRRPQDGDFLGPGIFPWSCPIILLVTTAVLNNKLRLLENYVKYLGSLHHVLYSVPLVTEEDEALLTEDEEMIVIDSYEGTVREMWEEIGDAFDIESDETWLGPGHHTPINPDPPTPTPTPPTEEDPEDPDDDPDGPGGDEPSDEEPEQPELEQPRPTEPEDPEQTTEDEADKSEETTDEEEEP